MAKGKNLGTFRAVAMGAQLGFTKDGTKEMVAVRFRVEEGPYANQVYTWRGLLPTDGDDKSVKQLRRTVESLRHAGASNPANVLDFSTMGTTVAEIVLEEDEWEGKPTVAISWVNALGGGAAMTKPANAQQMAASAARLAGLSKLTEGLIVKPSAVVANGSAGGAAHAPAGGAVDEIPFATSLECAVKLGSVPRWERF